MADRDTPDSKRVRSYLIATRTIRTRDFRSAPSSVLVFRLLAIVIGLAIVIIGLLGVVS